MDLILLDYADFRYIRYIWGVLRFRSPFASGVPLLTLPLPITERMIPMYCASCGTRIPEGATFCTGCGSPAPQPQGETLKPSSPPPAETPPSRPAGPVGFSDRCSHPEILQAASSSRRTSVGCMSILVLVPLIGFPLAGLLMDDFPLGEALVIGPGIAIIMLVVNLLALRSSRKPAWEGVVTDKFRKEKQQRHSGSDGDESYTTYMEYTTVIRTVSGKKKTIVEHDSGRDMYEYFSVGDRLRFHPAFGTYEKYDKSADRFIYCNVCRRKNPMANDRCSHCNNLLFK